MWYHGSRKKIKEDGDTVDGNRDEEINESNNEEDIRNMIVDIDIGNTNDLNDSPVIVRNPLIIADDIDVISLSGFEGNGSDCQEEEKTNGGEQSKDAVDGRADVFDENQPVRPPRKKKMQMKGLGVNSSPMKRGSSESELYRNIGASMFYEIC